MPVNNSGTGQRTQMLTFSGSVYRNVKWTISAPSGVAVQTHVDDQEWSGGFLPDPDTDEVDGTFTVTVE